MNTEEDGNETIQRLIQEAMKEQRTATPQELRCREAAASSFSTYVPCNEPATCFVLSERGRRVYPMCKACGFHNVTNRGAQYVYATKAANA